MFSRSAWRLRAQQVETDERAERVAQQHELAAEGRVERVPARHVLHVRAGRLRGKAARAEAAQEPRAEGLRATVSPARFWNGQG